MVARRRCGKQSRWRRGHGGIRGCWHGKMSWPVSLQGYSYRVCLSCGAMRLVNEKKFGAYGPFRNHLEQLIAWERSREPESNPRAKVQLPPA